MPGSLPVRASGHSNSPRSTSKLLRRARAAHDAGDAAKADRLYAELLETEPAGFDALHGLGPSNYRRRFDAALSLYSGGADGRSARADGFASLGLVFHACASSSMRSTSYDEACALRRTMPSFSTGAAWRCSSLAGRARRCDDFERVLAADPDSSRRARQSRQCAARSSIVPPRRLPIYDRALSVSAPDNAQLLTNRAAALRRLDRPHEALMSARRALASRAGFCPGAFCRRRRAIDAGRFSRRLARLMKSRWQVRLSGVAAAQFCRAAMAAASDRSTARPFCCMPSRVLATRFSSCATRRSSPACGANVVLEVQRRACAAAVAACAGVDAVIARGETVAAFRLSLSAAEPAARFRHGACNDPGGNPLHRAGGSTTCALWRARLPRPRARSIGLVVVGRTLARQRSSIVRCGLRHLRRCSICRM